MSTTTARRVQVVVGTQVLAEAFLATLPPKVLLAEVRRQYRLAANVSVLLRTIGVSQVPKGLADRIALRMDGTGVQA